MAPIRTSETVFLGVVVQPKTKQPVYIQRREGTQLTIEIVSKFAGAYKPMGSGYLNDMDDYAGATEITGLPRAHTSSGVEVRGGGYGTCVYTGLVLLATAEHDKQIFVRDLIGSGYGISSTASDSRTPSATRWWDASKRRGLTSREEGTTSPGDDDPEYETEEITDENAKDYLSTRTHRELVTAVENAFERYGSEWRVTDVTIKVDLERDVATDESGRSEQEIEVDFYTMDSAEKHKLVVCREIQVGDFMRWGNTTNFSSQFHGFKDVILALNVSGEDVRLVAKLALAARAGGATEKEITAMMMRNRFGVDVISRRALFEEPTTAETEAVLDAIARAGQGRPAQDAPRLPPDVERGTRRVAPHPNPAIRIRRNPAPMPTAADRRVIEANLVELEKRREDLGWNELEDLP